MRNNADFRRQQPKTGVLIDLRCESSSSALDETTAFESIPLMERGGTTPGRVTVNLRNKQPVEDTRSSSTVVSQQRLPSYSNREIFLSTVYACELHFC